MNKLRLTGLLLTRLLGLLLMYVSCVQVGYAQQSGGGNYPTGNGVRVKEVDGSPNVPGTQTLVFPNGSLTRAGQTVTVTLGGGLTVGTTTVTNGNSGRVFYNNAGVLGELTSVQTTALLSTEISAATNSAIAGSAVVFRYVATGAFTLPASLTGSYFIAGTSATSQADFLIKKNGSTFCTARFAAAGTTASYTSCSSSTSIVAGDLITIIAPATPDATLADLAISLKGSN